jgi:hypothetical protein
VATDGTNQIPMTWSDGKIATKNDLKDKEYVFISGRDAFHPNVFVKTTMKGIDECITKTTKNQARQIFIQVSKVLRDTNVDAIYNTPEWEDFCSDIIMYYSCRYILFNKPMPMIQNDEELQAS